MAWLLDNVRQFQWEIQDGRHLPGCSSEQIYLETYAEPTSKIIF